MAEYEFTYPQSQLVGSNVYHQSNLIYIFPKILLKLIFSRKKKAFLLQLPFSQDFVA
jgi:hypothetical protein